MPRAPILESSDGPEIVKMIVSLIDEGNYRDTAAAFAGVDRKTIHRWMKRGARDKREGIQSIYVELFEGILKADAKAEAWHVRNVREHSKGDWKASAFILSKKRPEVWGDKQKVEHSGEVIVRRYIGASPDDL